MCTKDQVSLIRQERDIYGDSWGTVLLEQYKIYVDSADKISERRTAANNYLLTLNTALVTLFGLISRHASTAIWQVAVPIAGILASFVWWWLIRSYRDLNAIKFQVIHELEKYLPAALYSYEWTLAKQGRSASYRPLSHLECWVPFIFMGIYIIMAISRL